MNTFTIQQSNWVLCVLFENRVAEGQVCEHHSKGLWTEEVSRGGHSASCEEDEEAEETLGTQGGSWDF